MRFACIAAILLSAPAIEAATRALAVWVSGRMGCAERYLAPQIRRYREEHPGERLDLYVATDVSFYRMPSAPELQPTGAHLQSCPFGEYVDRDPVCRGVGRPFCEHTVKMHCFNSRAFELILASGVRYDAVVKFRPDISQKRLPEIPYAGLNDTTVWVPQGWDWGPPETHLNDQVAIGTMAAMGKYAAAFADLPNFLARDGIKTEPERTVRHNVRLRGLAIARFPYTYELARERRDTPNGCGVI